MSLRAKFAILLGLLALTVALSLGTSLVFGSLIERELVWPLADSTRILRSFESIKRSIGSQETMLPGPTSGAESARPPGASLDAYKELSAAQDAALFALEADPAVERRIGVSTATNLSERLVEARSLAQAWFQHGAANAGIDAAAAHSQLREFIERIEQRLLDESPSALDYGTEMRAIYQTVIGAGVAAALLIAVLGVALMGRWVVRPVGRLREAAVRIGKGDFEHRVRVSSGDEIGQLSAEVNRMAGMIAGMQAEAVERERLAATGEMVRRLAHNLRNPLSAIRGLAELTRRRVGHDPAVKNDQEEIIAAVDRFNVWLTELLDVTSPMRIAPEHTRVRPWLQGILDSHRPLARMRGVTLEPALEDSPDKVVMDPRHMEHAIVALLTNAIQASPHGGRVRLCAALAEDDQFEIRIEDEGPGIPPELLEKIFRPYFTTKRDGNGIGLAVAQQVVRGHGGRIGVESVPGSGSKFTVRIPIGMVGLDQPAEISQLADVHREGSGNGTNSHSGGRGGTAANDRPEPRHGRAHDD